jgi:hypothetical protein
MLCTCGCCQWLQDLLMGRLKLKTKRQAFIVVLVACIAVALCIFGSVMLVWA